MDFIADAEDIRRLRRLTGATTADIRELGQEAKTQGCVRDRNEEEFEVATGITVSTLRSVKSR